MMNAGQIVSALATRHAQDVFVPQCKDGPSWGGQLGILDAWAMPRSWSPVRTIGYEVKVSKSDFRQDNKWPKYLACCHELYFVCPKGIIDPQEVAETCGLIYCSPSGHLLTKKKAPRREIVLPESLMLYLLMCRSKIVDSTYGKFDAGDPAEYWRKFLADDEADYKTGRACSLKLRQLIEKKIDEVEAENRRLVKDSEKHQDIKDFCEKAGIRIHSWNIEDEVRAKTQDKLVALLDELSNSLGRLHLRADEIRRGIQ